MNARNILLVASGSVLAGGASYAALSVGLTSVAVGVIGAAVAALATSVVLRNQALAGEVVQLRATLDTTRQHAGILARHMREMRESLHQGGVEAKTSAGTASGDFVALSGIVRDVADGLSELDRRAEALEFEVNDLRRRQDQESRPAAAAPGWVASAKAPAAPSPVAAPARETPSRDKPAAAAPQLMRETPAMPEAARPLEAPRAVRQLVAAAIAADRFDLFLQRIVQLPQRKVRGYDVTLRPDQSDLAITNEDIRLAVDTLGHQLPFDRRLVIQAVRLARMFEKRERDVVLFADISQRYLMSEAAFDELSALVEDAPSAPQRIVLCLPQRFFRKAIAFEHEALRRLSDLGFRFLLRDVEDFELDLGKLYQMGVRWIRADARDMVDAVQINPAIMGVASTDFVSVLNRRKISFIAENAGDDGTVAELLDLNVEFAHGAVFAPPQAVRADALDERDIAASAPAR